VTDSLGLAQALGVELTPEAGDLLERVQRHERALAGWERRLAVS